MPKGFVTFAGAGAGGLENLTIGVFNAIKDAECILYDALVDEEIIQTFPQKCIKICVGKRYGNHSIPQEKTNEILVKLALKGLKVLRLKGGDPSIFSRITEEREALDAYQIPHKTLAGLSAAQVAAAQFDISLTERKKVRSLEFITASNFLNQCAIGENIIGNGKTIAFYMGSKKAEEIVNICIANNISPKMPVAIIENAGRDYAKFASGHLEDMQELINSIASGGPILILMGEVIKLKSAELCQAPKASHLSF